MRRELIHAARQSQAPVWDQIARISLDRNFLSLIDQVFDRGDGAQDEQATWRKGATPLADRRSASRARHGHLPTFLARLCIAHTRAHAAAPVRF
jgi:hypothetical protein